MLVSRESVGRFHIPVHGDLGDTWTDLAFDDDTWSIVNQSLGYSVDVSKESGEPGESLPRPEVFGDVSRPGDRLIATSNRSPAGEEGLRAIDNDPDTKYLNFDKLNAGFTVTLAQRSVVNSLRLTSANDAPQRDPTRLILSGSNDGSSFQEIGRKEIPEFTARHQTLAVAMSNDQSYRYYRLIFPTIRDAASAVAMQIAEVEFIGPISEESISTESGKLNFDRFQTLTQPDDPIEPTSFNSPENEEVWRAIDNLAATKYLNFDGADSGFTVTPKVGDTVVKGLRLTSGNDAPGRDPASFWLGGSTNGSTFDFVAGCSFQDGLPSSDSDRQCYLTGAIVFCSRRSRGRSTVDADCGSRVCWSGGFAFTCLERPDCDRRGRHDVRPTWFGLSSISLQESSGKTLDNLILNTRFDLWICPFKWFGNLTKKCPS